MYTNELPTTINHDVIQFADDTSIIFSEVNIETSVCQALNILENWFTENNLLLNIDKTQIVKFSRQANDKLILTNGISTLTTSDNVTFLGIKIDSRLDWKTQIQNLSKDHCYVIRIISNSLDKVSTLNVYYAYVHSKLRYGIIFCSNSPDINKIFVLQKRCFRIIFRLRQMKSYKTVFKENKILTLYSSHICICIDTFYTYNGYIVFFHKRNKYRLSIYVERVQITN